MGLEYLAKAFLQQAAAMRECYTDEPLSRDLSDFALSDLLSLSLTLSLSLFLFLSLSLSLFLSFSSEHNKDLSVSPLPHR